MRSIDRHRRNLRPARWRHLLSGLLLGGLAPAVHADHALVAVAANFTEVLEALQIEFERESAHRLTLTSGSTGKLYTQITNGAPFDVLLAADQARPERLEAEGAAVSGSRFTYAVGRLALWSADPARIGEDGAQTLRTGAFRHLAIANPDLAPYGVAARDVVERLGLTDALADRIVMGENIGQTYAMVASGNAELGFVALSSLLGPQRSGTGSRWVVPAELHTPIRQDAVLLAHGADNPAARAFLAFLAGAHARDIVERFGYGVD